MSKNLKIIPLGGLGEIGKNMTVLEFGRNQLIIDCGVMFPESDMYGIDLVLPRFDYVLKNQSSLRGIVLTHGHLDHIGGLPYLLKQMRVPEGGIPVYGTALTIGMVRQKLEEMNVAERAKLVIIDDQHSLSLGPFRVSPYTVAHSIPGSVGLVIDTPVGAIIHTGDYKLDETPSGGCTTDLRRLRELTPNGVLAMLGESTNADRPGRTPTEQIVTDTLDELFAKAAGDRIIIATFSTLVARLQEILRLAEKHGRKVAITGHSLEQTVELATELGYLHIPEGLIVDVGSKVRDDQLVILSTGSQGEPRSALNRMANGTHRQIQVRAGDTIIVSGGTIPGNEEDVGRMLNNLFARGANVVYGRLATVHVSGHASRDELSEMLATVQPRYLIPVHGEIRHLHLHSRLAQENGLSAKQVFILQNGAAWVSDGEKAWLEQSVPAGDVYVDGYLVGTISEQVVQDRERLAQDGFVVVNVPLNKKQRLAGEPLIVTRGVLHSNESDELMETALVELKRSLHVQGRRKQRSPSETVEETLQNFFYKKTQSRPVILSNFVMV
jgi:ribonuclease J